jgi:predicted RNase H-like nuclease (RuvC/YqgF family)
MNEVAHNLSHLRRNMSNLCRNINELARNMSHLCSQINEVAHKMNHLCTGMDGIEHNYEASVQRDGRSYAQNEAFVYRTDPRRAAD